MRAEFADPGAGGAAQHRVPAGVRSEGVEVEFAVLDGGGRLAAIALRDGLHPRILPALVHKHLLCTQEHVNQAIQHTWRDVEKGRQDG